jgi:hypothetical protein
MSNPVRLTALLTITASLALGALAGCMTVHDAGSAAMANYGLYYSESQDEGAKLAYGLENSDELSLMLQCKPGSGRVEVFQLYGPVRNGPLVLASAGQRSVLTAKAEATDGPGDTEIRAVTPATTPALVGFKKTGKLDVSGKGYRYSVVARPEGKVEVSRFFAACGTV